jgi:cell division protein ZapB
MDFFTYSGVMEADLKSLEEKIGKLVSLCSNLREENVRLRSDLTQTKGNMLLASNKLEGLLKSMPQNNEPADVET